MNSDNEPRPIVLELDSFWQENAGKIRSCQTVIKYPKTLAGENILKDSLINPVFIAYNRLPSIFGSLITLVEYDEIFKKEGIVHFSQPENQRLVLRALGLKIEDSIKFPYGPDEKKNYEDLRPFFEGLLKGFRDLDANITRGSQSVNFVNLLITVFQQEVNKLKGVDNFSVKIKEIRKKICGYLPSLSLFEKGKILQEIKNLLLFPASASQS